MYDEFNSTVMEWLKSRIRDVIENPKRDFVSDKIDQDTYFQQREYNHSDIYYIIYQKNLPILKQRFTEIRQAEEMQLRLKQSIT